MIVHFGVANLKVREGLQGGENKSDGFARGKDLLLRGRLMQGEKRDEGFEDHGEDGGQRWGV